jgi:Fe-S cluster biogenesis protein NfuA
VRQALLARLDELRRVLEAHAGGIELVEVAGGIVSLRYTGMCTGCQLRPLTTASTVRPALLALPGVEAVEIEGSRISAEAEARLAAALAPCGGPEGGTFAVRPRQLEGGRHD